MLPTEAHRAGPSAFDHTKIVASVRLLLEGLGLDPDAPRTKATPQRVAEMYEEIFRGIAIDPFETLDAVFDENYDELVLVKDIPFASMCEHHFLPFIGRAHVGYLPNKQGQVTGLSKLARVVDAITQRPTMQERATTAIVDTIERALSPRGVIAVLEAEHLCMTIRGVQKPGTLTITSALRGLVRDDPRTRAEAMALLTRRA